MCTNCNACGDYLWILDVQFLHTCYTTLMLSIETAVRDYFDRLGYEPEVAKLYLALISNGPQHIAALSRLSGVERTKIYRLIDVLLEAELIEITTEGTRGIMQAAPIANIRALLARRESELKSLHQNLELLEHAMKQHEVSSPTTRVRLYTDATGMRSLLKSSLPSENTVLYMLCIEPIEHYVGSKFMQEWSALLHTTESSIYYLFTPKAAALHHAWHKQHKLVQCAPFQARIIPPDIADPTNSLLIWPDRIAFAERAHTSLHMTLIENKATATLQRVYFELLWRQSAEI